MSMHRKFSEYYSQLEADAKKRYNEKLDIIGQVDDPYIFVSGLAITEAPSIPDIEYPDIYNFLINTPSPRRIEGLQEFGRLQVPTCWLVSQATPLNLREKGGPVTTRTTSARNPCATNQVRDFEILCTVS